MERKGTLASEAVARASSVFPVPGGPYSRAPCGWGKGFGDILSWGDVTSGSGQYTHLGYSATQFRVSAWMPEVVDKLHHLILCLLHASHVSEAAQIQQSALTVALIFLSAQGRPHPLLSAQGRSLVCRVKLAIGHHSRHSGKAVMAIQYVAYSLYSLYPGLLTPAFVVSTASKRQMLWWEGRVLTACSPG